MQPAVQTSSKVDQGKQTSYVATYTFVNCIKMMEYIDTYRYLSNNLMVMFYTYISRFNKGVCTIALGHS